MTTAGLLHNIRVRLAPVAGDFALPEAERILGFLLNCSRSELYLDQRQPAPALAQSVEAIIARRLDDEPLAYILGSAFFYDKEFVVSPDVLIPRPDTEILVEEVLKHEPAHHCRFLDIGTGSGCIAAALTGQKTGWRALGVDLSFRALTIARKNCGPRVSFACVNFLSALKIRSCFDFIVSNPPYIKTADLPALQPSVRNYEPKSALDGGIDGLDFYRLMASATPPLLRPGGGIYCEIGYDQGQSVPEIFNASGWTAIEVTRDYGGNPRVVRARRAVSS
jgi:release factor glutamine methyltransferase